MVVVVEVLVGGLCVCDSVVDLVKLRDSTQVLVRYTMSNSRRNHS